MSTESNNIYPVSKRPRRISNRFNLEFGSDSYKSQSIDLKLNSLLKEDIKPKIKSLASSQHLSLTKSLRIYAYLSVRLRYNPIFLNRNLSYIKSKKKLQNRRKKISLDSLLKQLKVKKDDEQEVENLNIQLDSIKIELMDVKKTYIIDFKLIGLCKQSRKSSHSIFNQSDNSIILYEKKIYNFNGEISIDGFFPVSSKISSLYFHIKIDENFREYYLNFDLREFLDSKLDSLIFNLKLNDSSIGTKIHKASSSVDQLINKFRSNENFIRFKLINESKITKLKLKTTSILKNSKKSSPLQNSSKTKCLNSASVIYNLSIYDSSKNILAFSNDLKCPFCFILLNSFTCLVSHLKSIHFRFICHEFQQSSSQKIDIIPDDMFDGSYSISDMFNYKKNEYMGFGKSRVKPVKRKPGLLFWVYSSFFGKMIRKNEDIELAFTLHSQNLTPINFVHNRIYYHSLTNLAKNYNSDEDSDDEQEWIKMIRDRNFDQFEYINHGEKKIMCLWNDFCSQHNLIAHSNVFNICQLFVKENKIYLKNLEKNLLLHFFNLLDYKLLRKKELIKLIEMINELTRVTG